MFAGPSNGPQDTKSNAEPSDADRRQEMLEIIHKMVMIYVTTCHQTGCSINVPVPSYSTARHPKGIAAPVESIVSQYEVTREIERGSNILPSIVIPVMGPTGSGKTTFINNASNAKLPLGRGLGSGTNDIQPVTFEFDGHVITLIDTPGFEGIFQNDVEIFQLSATYLSTAYRYHAKLGGVIYLHRIPDPRRDASERSLRRFQKACINNNWKNIVIATNVWQPESSLAQKQDPESEGKSIKSALGNDTTLFRIHNTTESAHQLLRQLITSRSSLPQPLLSIIAVVGNPGSGKTTFVSRASRVDLLVGQGSEAHSTDIQHSVLQLDGRVIVLLDTPGVEDAQSVSEISQRISTWLMNMYQKSARLAGIIYLHNVTDHLPRGNFRWTLEQFSKLCEAKKPKIAIVPNMWRKVGWEIKSTQEQFLASHDLYVNTVLDVGGKIVPHDDTWKSANEVIRQLLRNK